MITSTNNEAIKLARSLQHRKSRDSTGLLYVEGLRPFVESLDLANDLEMVLAAPSLLNPDMKGIVDRCQSYGVRVLEVAEPVLRALSERDNPDGLAAIVRQRWHSLDAIDPSQGDYWVALHSIREPRNIGAILRVTDAVGAAGIILLDDSADPYSPFAVRASTGAVFSQALVRSSFDAFRNWLDVHNIPCIGTSAEADTDYIEVAYPRPMVLLMGSERSGLTPEQEAICDALVRIPMAGHVESLNVAVATGILLYEAFNQARTQVPPMEGESDLSPESTDPHQQ
jgi:RNA methyltransferase, TrmH family